MNLLNDLIKIQVVPYIITYINNYYTSLKRQIIKIFKSYIYTLIIMIIITI